jgi:AcrR family transcriptional regulator
MMQERAHQTRRAILQAAAEMFEARGYFGTRLQDIVTGKHISKGALYFHFQSKETLAQAIVAEQYNMWSEAISELRAKYARAIRVVLELSWQAARMCRDETLMRAGIRLVAERNLADPSVPHPFIRLAGVVEELLAEAQAQHDLLPDVDIKKVAHFMAATFSGLQQASPERNGRDTENGRADLPQCITTMWRYVLPGLVTAECLADMSAVFSELGRTS